MSRPKCLDLFCGVGGAAMGLHRAGFDVTGIDNRPQPVLLSIHADIGRARKAQRKGGHLDGLREVRQRALGDRSQQESALLWVQSRTGARPQKRAATSAMGRWAVKAGQWVREHLVVAQRSAGGDARGQGPGL